MCLYNCEAGERLSQHYTKDKNKVLIDLIDVVDTLKCVPSKGGVYWTYKPTTLPHTKPTGLHSQHLCWNHRILIHLLKFNRLAPDTWPKLNQSHFLFREFGLGTISFWFSLAAAVNRKHVKTKKIDGHFPPRICKAKKIGLPRAGNKADVEQQADPERVPNGILSTWFQNLLVPTRCSQKCTPAGRGKASHFVPLTEVCRWSQREQAPA